MTKAKSKMVKGWVIYDGWVYNFTDNKLIADCWKLNFEVRPATLEYEEDE